MECEWLLLTGAPRSGTTLLAELINLHSHAHLLHEIDVLDLVNKTQQISKVLIADCFQPVEDKATRNVAADPRIPVVKSRVDLAYAQTQTFYEKRPQPPLHSSTRDTVTRQLTKSLWQASSQKADLKVIGSKLPLAHWTTSAVAAFRETFQPKMVFIVRNPIDVVNSSMRRRYSTTKGLDDWPIHSVEEACRQWHEAWTYLLGSLARDPLRTLVVSYEQLCMDAPGVMRKVFAFLGLDDIVVENLPNALPDRLKQAFLDGAELTYARHYFHNMLSITDQKSLELALISQPRIAAAADCGIAVKFNTAQADAYCQSGFFALEEWGRWTGGRAILAFTVDPDHGGGVVEIKHRGAIRNARGTALCAYSVNGRPRVYFDASVPGSLIVDVGEYTPPSDGIVEIEIVVFEPKTADQEPTFDDRPLGLALEWFFVMDRPMSSANKRQPASRSEHVLPIDKNVRPMQLNQKRRR